MLLPLFIIVMLLTGVISSFLSRKIVNWSIYRRIVGFFGAITGGVSEILILILCISPILLLPDELHVYRSYLIWLFILGVGIGRYFHYRRDQRR